MREFANQLMTLTQKRDTSAAQPSAIFGSATTLSRSLQLGPNHRIGFWPIVSQAEPEIAMGLATVIALLLERWRDVRVYRVFSSNQTVDGEFTWTISDSQFGVDDWPLEELDDNVSIWGALSVNADVWSLRLEIENDVSDIEENTAFSYEAASLSSLYFSLPQIVSDIANELGFSGNIIKLDGSPNLSDVNLRVFLRRALQWQVHLSHSLLRQEWSEDSILDALEGLCSSASAVDDEISTWSVASLVSHSTLPGYGDIGEIVLENADKVTSSLSEWPLVVTVIGLTYYRSGEPQSSYELLETQVERTPEATIVWRTLAELYRNGGRAQDALDTFQRAIEEDATDSILLVRYADLVLNLDFDGHEIDEYILCDPDDEEIAGELPLWEAIEAYKEALSLDPENLITVQHLVSRLLDVDVLDGEFWDHVQLLVKLDHSGERLRAVIETMYESTEIESLIQILETEQQIRSDDVTLLLNLAAANLVGENSEAAKQTLTIARKLTEDTSLIGEIDRLELEADDPEFDAKVTEYGQIIDAGRGLKNSDIDYLEEILERVPSLSEIWVLVARAYLAWNDSESALETLLDGYSHVPNDADLVAQLVDILWHSGQQSLALDYLKKSIEIHPFDVPLIARFGRYLFEYGDRDTARIHLARAEAIGPRHPELIKARTIVSNILSSEA